MAFTQSHSISFPRGVDAQVFNATIYAQDAGETACGSMHMQRLRYFTKMHSPSLQKTPRCPQATHNQLFCLLSQLSSVNNWLLLSWLAQSITLIISCWGAMQGLCISCKHHVLPKNEKKTWNSQPHRVYVPWPFLFLENPYPHMCFSHHVTK